jgi:hypothetical protein
MGQFCVNKKVEDEGGYDDELTLPNQAKVLK